jgi:hypothetical protein
LLPEYIIHHALSDQDENNSVDLWKGFSSVEMKSPFSYKFTNSGSSPQVAPLESRIHRYINTSKRLLNLDAAVNTPSAEPKF